VIDLKDLKERTIVFLDNGGALHDDERFCSYCKGSRDPKSSDSPAEAVVSLRNDRQTSYGVYITVQNELVAAYNTLRNREAQRLYKMDFTSMEKLYRNNETPAKTKAKLKIKIRHIQDLFPMKLSEAELTKN
jgi:hypothetical protein